MNVGLTQRFVHVGRDPVSECRPQTKSTVGMDVSISVLNPKYL